MSTSDSGDGDDPPGFRPGSRGTWSYTACAVGSTPLGSSGRSNCTVGKWYPEPASARLTASTPPNTVPVASVTAATPPLSRTVAPSEYVLVDENSGKPAPPTVNVPVGADGAG